MSIQLLKSFFFPSPCILCGQTETTHFYLCNLCYQTELPWLKHACQRCGCSLYPSYPAPSPDLSKAMGIVEADVENSLTCGRCLKDPPAFSTIKVFWDYQPPFTQLITRLKFNAKLHYARLLGEWMADELEKIPSADRPHCLIPVPLHRKRLQERGYNQALEIAKPIAKRLNIRLTIDQCERVQNTQPQSDLDAKQRARNVSQAFHLSRPLKGSHIALMDDVVTTGHTVNSLSKQFKQAGAERIDVWCVGRASLLFK